MNVPRFVIFALMIFCSLLSAQGKKKPTEINAERCKRVANSTNNGRNCGKSSCPVFNECVRKKFSKRAPAKKGFIANSKNCQGMKTRTKNVSKARLNKIEKCKTAGCQKFKACRKFFQSSSNGKPKNGKPKNGKPKNGKPKNGKPKNGTPKNGTSSAKK